MRSIFAFLLFTFVGLATVFAQPITTSTPGKMLSLAEESLAKNDYYNALEWYGKYYDEVKDREIANTIATMHYQLRDYNKAEKWFKRVADKDKKNKFPDARFHYARMLKMNGKYDESIVQFQQFINESANTELVAKAKMEVTGAEMVKDLPEPEALTIENGGKNLNSKYSEYSPVIVGGDQMYFTAMRRDEILVMDGKEKDYHSKAFTATRQGDGWTKAKELGDEINRPGFHIGNLAVSADGERMYFSRMRLNGNEIEESKLYVSSKDGNDWSGAKVLAGVNGEYIAKQPTLGELYGKEVLFFVSDMDGGYGGNDIYYATRKGEAAFGDPINLGSSINTSGHDETPFYRDGTLYFSSTGHPGMGGFDIFSTVWDGSGWSSPENLGKGYNTSVDDLYFSVDKEGYSGFLVSNRPGGRSVKSKTCCNDIYTVDLEKLVLDVNALTFSGGKALNDVIVQLVEMKDNTEGDTNEKTTGDANTTNFGLKSEMAYVLIASKEGYEDARLEFNTVGITKSESMTKKLDLKFIPPPPPPPPPPKEPEYETYTTNEAIRLNNIYYDYDDDKILIESERDLSLVLELMNKYPDMVIELSSHTDSRGKDSYNQNLSQRRAQSAKNWLVTRSVATERIKAVGYGESVILNRCTNGVKCEDDEHRFNRRTEVKIISGPTSIQIEKKRLKKQ